MLPGIRRNDGVQGSPQPVRVLPSNYTGRYYEEQGGLAVVGLSPGQNIVECGREGQGSSARWSLELTLGGVKRS